MPVSARASSVRPDPSSPATPSTSPSRSSTSALRIPRPTLTSLAVSTGCCSSSGIVDVRAGIDLSGAAAQHRLHEVDAQQLFREVLADEFAVAEHRHAVADLVHLIEEMRHEQDRNTALRKITDHAEQFADLVEVEARRGLVEHEDPHVCGDRARDGDQLLDGDRVRAQRGGGVDVETEIRQRLTRFAPHPTPIDAAPSTRLPPEGDVLGDGDIRQQVDLLVDRADAGQLCIMRRPELHDLSHRSRAFPSSRGIAPVIALMSVDLPAPFSPIKEWTSPGNIRKLNAVDGRHPRRSGPWLRSAPTFGSGCSI